MARNNEKRQAEIIVNGQKAEASIKDMAAAAAILNKQIRGLTPGTQDFVNKSQQLQTVRKRLKDVNDQVRGVDASTKKAKMGFLGINSATDLMKKGFDLAMRSLLPLFAFQKLVEVAQHVLGIESAYKKLSGSIQQTTQLQGQALDEATIKVQALTNTFEVESGQIIKAANAISREFGISVPEALAKVEQGLVAAADKDEFLEQAREYSTQFAQAGIEAEGFVAQLIRAEQEGIFSDKGADAIKEFGLRIREQTTATSKALRDAFGDQFTDEIFGGINDGSITTAQALERVSQKLNDTTVPANKLQTVIADTFGGPGEDAGLRYLQTLTNVGGSIDELIDRTNPYIAQQEAQLELQKELAAAEAELADELAGSSAIWEAFTTNLQILGTQVLVKIVQGFGVLKNTVIGIGEVINTLSTNFSAAFAALLSGDFDTFSAIGKNLGKRLSESFNTGFREQEEMEAARRQAEKEKQQEQERLQAEKAAKEQAAAVAKVNKEEAEKLRKQREEAKKAELEAEKAIEDLKLELIQNSTEREIAKINLDTERKIEALKGSEEQITEQKLLLEQQRDQRLKELQAQLREQEAQAIEERMALEEEEQAIMEEEERLRIEEKFINGLIAEENYQQQLLDLQKQALESKLAILVQAGQAESLEAQKLKNAIIKIEQDKSKAAIKAEEEKVKAKQQLQQIELSALQGTVQETLGFFSQLRDAEGKQTKAAKFATRAGIVLSGALEVANIWKEASKFGPILGPILGAAQTALAVARTVGAVSKVDGVETRTFAKGGYTGAGTYKDHTGHRVAGVVHQNEWVAPEWMNEHPVYANTIGMLETVRKRGFATGGFESEGVRAAQTPAPSGQLEGIETLRQEFRMLFDKIDTWQREIKVINNVGETQDGINVLNEIRQDGSIS